MKHIPYRPCKTSISVCASVVTSVEFEFSFMQDLVKKYSEFINFPIYLWSTKEVDVEVPADEGETSDEEDSSKSLVKLFILLRW